MGAFPVDCPPPLSSPGRGDDPFHRIPRRTARRHRPRTRPFHHG